MARVKVIHKGKQTITVPARFEEQWNGERMVEVEVEPAYQIETTLPPGSRLADLVIHKVHEVDEKWAETLVEKGGFEYYE